MKKKKIFVLIPCFNEEKAIGKVIDGFQAVRRRYSHNYKFEILVIDNNSSDKTAEVARLKGAKVICELHKGKGNAIKTGFKNISSDADYVVMIDGDNTYKPQEVMRMIEPLNSGFCDVILGSRLSGKMLHNSMKFTNRLGNWVYSFMIRQFYLENVTDVLTGYFAWKKEAIDRLAPHLTSNDFSIEMEMITKMAKLRFEVYSVPITYDERIGTSNLNPFSDGKRILGMFFKNLYWKPRRRHNINNPVRLAYVTDSIYPYNKGGKEKRFYEITRRLAKRGYDVHIYCMHWWKSDKPTMNKYGVHYHAISKYYPLYANGRRSFLQAIYFSLSCFKMINEKFDLIDADHMPHLILFPLKIVSILKRRPFYCSWNEVWGQHYWRQYIGKLGLIAYWIEWMSIRLPNKIISISTHTTNKLVRDLNMSKKKINTIPIGVDLEYIKAIKPSLIKSDILFAGRLLEYKGIDLLIDAVQLLKKKYPKIRCILVGNGPEESHIDHMIEQKDLKSNIHRFDFYEKDYDIYALMKSTKVFVLPSKREGFGMVVIEANSAGVPVVTIQYKDNAAKDLIIEGVNGMVVKNDRKDLSKAIGKLLSKPLKKREIVKTVAPYNWDKILDRIIIYYDL